MHAEPQHTRLRKEQQAAGLMQRRMLPGAPVELGGYRANFELWPADILSGDFLDVVELDDQRFAFLVADVAGHGTGAALVTVLLKSFATRLPQSANRGPAEMLSELNRELLAVNLERHACVLCGVVNRATHSLELASGGAYPRPLLVRKNSDAESLKIDGKALGLFDDGDFAQLRIELGPGDRLVVVSDGVFELLTDASLQAKENRLAGAAVAPSASDFWQRLLVKPEDGCCDDTTWFELERL